MKPSAKIRAIVGPPSAVMELRAGQDTIVNLLKQILIELQNQARPVSYSSPITITSGKTWSDDDEETDQPIHFTKAETSEPMLHGHEEGGAACDCKP